ncbi:hypothetical protein ABZP36_030110 [Zizania latifolia]
MPAAGQFEMDSQDRALGDSNGILGSKQILSFFSLKYCKSCRLEPPAPSLGRAACAPARRTNPGADRSQEARETGWPYGPDARARTHGVGWRRGGGQGPRAAMPFLPPPSTRGIQQSTMWGEDCPAPLSSSSVARLLPLLLLLLLLLDPSPPPLSPGPLTSPL